MRVLTLKTENEPQEVKEPDCAGGSAPFLKPSWRGNPLEHRTAFEPGDAIRANDLSNGLVPGRDYLILGYWLRNGTHMYVYLEGTGNGHMASFRTAVEELGPVELARQEVLFYNIKPSDQITEICIQDCLKSKFRGRSKDQMQSLVYVPMMEQQVNMKVSHNGPQPDENGQYQLFSMTA